MQALLLVLLSLLLGLLILPIAIRVQVRSCRRPAQYRLEGGVLLGLCGLSVSGPGPPWTLRARLLGWVPRWPGMRLGKTASVASTHDSATLGTASRQGAMSSAAVVRALWHPAWRLLMRVPSCIGVRRLRVRGRLGLDDPAHTGMVCAGLQAIRGPSWRALRIDLAPDFVRPGFCGTAEILLHIHLGRLLWLVLNAGVRFGLNWIRLRRRRPSATARP